MGTGANPTYGCESPCRAEDAKHGYPHGRKPLGGGRRGEGGLGRGGVRGCGWFGVGYSTEE
jgi:hypothetical protein